MCQFFWGEKICPGVEVQPNRGDHIRVLSPQCLVTETKWMRPSRCAARIGLGVNGVFRTRASRACLLELLGSINHAGPDRSYMQGLACVGCVIAGRITEHGQGWAPTTSSHCLFGRSIMICAPTTVQNVGLTTPPPVAPFLLHVDIHALEVGADPETGWPHHCGREVAASAMPIVTRPPTRRPASVCQSVYDALSRARASQAMTDAEVNTCIHHTRHDWPSSLLEARLGMCTDCFVSWLLRAYPADSHDEVRAMVPNIPFFVGVP